MTGAIEKSDAREETRTKRLRGAPAAADASNAAWRRGEEEPVGTRDGMTTVWEPNEAARTMGGSEMMRGSHASVDVAVML